MPGLVGIFSKNKVDEYFLDKMINSLKHYDYFKTDKFIESNFGIARVHLGIFNPEPQPIFNEDKSLCIFMDGKIYDYKSELDKLKKLGHKFTIENDAEFCIHSFEKYGTDFIKKLNGSFTIVINDFKKNKLFLYCDRFRQRPLYYTITNRKLLFSSEVKSILVDEKFEPKLDFEAVADFITFRKIMRNKTFFKGIKVLPAASILTYNGKKISIDKYWDLEYIPNYSKSDDEFVDDLIKTFKNAIKIRMRDNLRYGVSLSGGLDSRSLIAGIEKKDRKNILTFSFGPSDCDEVKIAKIVSNIAKTRFMEIEITPDLFIENSEQEVWLSDGRGYIGLSYIFPIHKNLRSKIDVMFDGFAMDLTLGGSFLNKKIFNSQNKEELLNNLNTTNLLSREELKKLFLPDIYKKIKDSPKKSLELEFNQTNNGHFANMSDYFAIQTHISYITIGHILVRNAIEVVYPTLDNNFINIIRTIPPEKRFKHYIYRKFLKKLSPELAKIKYNKTMIRADFPLILWDIGKYFQGGKELIKDKINNISRGKINIQSNRNYVNFTEWIRTNETWKMYLKKLLLTDETVSKKYFDQSYIRYLFQLHEEGISDNSLKILHLATFELFLRKNFT